MIKWFTGLNPSTITCMDIFFTLICCNNRTISERKEAGIAHIEKTKKPFASSIKIRTILSHFWRSHLTHLSISTHLYFCFSPSWTNRVGVLHTKLLQTFELTFTITFTITFTLTFQLTFPLTFRDTSVVDFVILTSSNNYFLDFWREKIH